MIGKIESCQIERWQWT